jgi:hypothetical protein
MAGPKARPFFCAEQESGRAGVSSGEADRGYHSLNQPRKFLGFDPFTGCKARNKIPGLVIIRSPRYGKQRSAS